MPETLKHAITKYNALSLILAEGSLDTLGGVPPVLLSFDMQPQIQTQWCWAATSVSVSQFYDQDSSWTQCEVAELIMGSSCCQNPSPCNKPWYLDEALTVTNNFVSQSAPFTFQQVEGELKNDRVVCARVGWWGGGGHFMVIYGCRTLNGVNYYSIDDPIYGKSEITETAFLDAYQGSGRWTHSYTTKPNIIVI
ncbi:papain-like cysteine protease family protein [Telluribacter sp. SYSU D00476]|uniref:papain-like cysteine protease family protein n=1 Tax=Telluribacter sp. SYSU D00476 TaxID=2811430 RepID=UPI001FF33CE2|nr:papain-like cysteine protease family protein [Telluribacter sp. SYSU D00476]